MAISPTLVKVLNEITHTTPDGVTGVTGVTEEKASAISTHCGDARLLHHETGARVTGVTPPVADGEAAPGLLHLLHQEQKTSVTTQVIENVPIAGSVTPVTPVTPPKHDSPSLHTLFSELERQSPVAITEARELEVLLPVLCAAPLVGVDTETTGLDPLTHRLRLVQFAVPGGPVVAVDTWQVPVQVLEPIFTAKHVLALHNAKFDLKMLAAAGLPWPTARLFDTQVAAKLLGAGTEAGRLNACGLATLAQRWLGIEVDKSLQQSDWSGSLAPGKRSQGVKFISH